MIIKTLQIDNTLRRLKLVEVSRNLNYHGIRGKMAFDQDGETIKDIFMFSIDDNKRKLVRRIKVTL
jgi:hypothetical protein